MNEPWMLDTHRWRHKPSFDDVLDSNLDRLSHPQVLENYWQRNVRKDFVYAARLATNETKQV